MKQIAKYFIGKIILWTLVYFAFYQHVGGAENLLKFLIFASAFASLFAIREEAVKAEAKLPPRDWLRWWSVINGFALLG